MNSEVKPGDMPYMRWFAWGATTKFVIIQYYMIIFPGIASVQLMKDFSLDAVQMSFISSVFFYTYILIQIPAGLLLGRYNLNIILFIAIITAFVGCVIFGLAPNYPVAIIGRLVMGLGAGFGFLGMIVTVGRFFPPTSFSFGVGLSQFVSLLFTAFGMRLIEPIITSFGWRGTTVGLAVLGVINAILVFIFLRNAPSQPSGEGDTGKGMSLWRQLKLAAAEKQIWIAGGFGFCMFSIITVFASLWSLSYLESVYHLTASQAGLALALLFVAAAIGYPSVGRMADKTGKSRPFMIAGSLSALIIMLILIQGFKLPLIMVYVLTCLLGFSACSTMLSYTIPKWRSSPEIESAAISIANLIIMLPGVLIQPLIGFLIQMHSGKSGKDTPGGTHYSAADFQFSHWVFAVLFLIAVILAFMAKNKPETPETFIEDR